MESNCKGERGGGGQKMHAYTLLQKKRNFSGPIFSGDPGSLTLTPGHVLQCSSIYTLPKKKCIFPCCVSFEGECTFLLSIELYLRSLKKLAAIQTIVSLLRDISILKFINYPS